MNGATNVRRGRITGKERNPAADGIYSRCLVKNNSLEMVVIGDESWCHQLKLESQRISENGSIRTLCRQLDGQLLRQPDQRCSLQ
ncbi:hypothetical protein NPIL_344011 [Nephila pilipes]|uniref:Uncharacterized protein n=1 Tax=Nephila pilipes TaxID=299642 RepID=A0A8X6U8C1_NEPPI|nr:hypothetical protein NPIL_344011 [Nephila pilipes]